jgi:hypothetical protein
MTATNLHPVDELADVRSRIKALEEREGQLRDELLSGRVGLEGNDHVARLVDQQRAWINLRSARRALGKVLDPFLTEKAVTAVRLAPKDGDEAE